MNRDKKRQSFEKFSNFVIFQTKTGKINIDVFFQDETLWLPQKKMAELFEVNIPAISKHLKNIFKTAELQENSVISILETTAADGKNYRTQYYCLDARLHSFVKSRRTHVFVIPAKAGIQSFQIVTWDLNPGLRRGDDFLQDHET